MLSLFCEEEGREKFLNFSLHFFFFRFYCCLFGLGFDLLGGEREGIEGIKVSNHECDAPAEEHCFWSHFHFI